MMVIADHHGALRFHTWHYSKCFIHSSSFNPQNDPGKQICYYLHFTEKETEVQRHSKIVDICQSKRERGATSTEGFSSFQVIEFRLEHL